MRDRVRAPRIVVTLDGVPLPGVLSAEVHSNNHLSADRFLVRFSASLVPERALHVPHLRLDISVELDGALTSLIVGIADSVSFNPVLGVIDVEGRDLSALLIESQTEETFANKTASEIATLFASRHGLAAFVDPTSTPIGRYYQSEHDRVAISQFARSTTEWDLLALLAAREGCDLATKGHALYFGVNPPSTPIVIAPQTCTRLQLHHSVDLSRSLDVTVRSWGTKSGSAVAQTVRSPGSLPTLKRRITRPNLTSDAAQAIAARVIADLKRHEWVAEATMPGDLIVTSRSLVAIEGMPSPWNQVFSITRLSRHLDVRRGFTQTLSLQGLA